jgi:hypothetical protein
MVQSFLTFLRSVVEIPPSFPVNNQEQLNNRYRTIATEDKEDLKMSLLSQRE